MRPKVLSTHHLFIVIATENHLVPTGKTTTHPLAELLRRMSVVAVLLWICLPATQAHAAINSLNGSLKSLLLGDSGVCLEATSSQEANELAMSIDPRTLQMSIDGRALQNLQIAAQHLDTSTPLQQPCDSAAPEEIDGAELCSKLPDDAALPGVEEPQEDEHVFVPASLNEDIAPLEPPSRHSCSASSSSPDRCEPHPPLPQQISLEVHSTGALFDLVHAPNHPREPDYTLALAPIWTTSLLGPADGFPRGPDQPPRA